MLRRPRIGAVFALTMLLGACALPRSGPSAEDFNRAAQDRSINLIEATMDDAIASRSNSHEGFGPDWASVMEAPIGVIGVGDILSIALFENDGLNLFSSGGPGGAKFDALVVDPSGTIQLPYVGQVRVAGLTPNQARTNILKSLRHIALTSDVTITVTERRSQMVSVQGDVTRPGMVTLGPDTARLTRLLSVAAPAPANQELAMVTVRRGAASATVPLVDIYEKTAADIAMRAGDVVIVRSAPATVNVLGAAGMQGRVRITRRNYSLTDAVADARGLDDAAASPAAVYVMRLSDPAEARTTVPRVFHFNFRDPAQIAVASAFAVHDGDAVLISNASFAQSHKVLSAFSSVINTARSAAYVAP